MQGSHFFQAFNSVCTKQHVPLWPLRPARACQSKSSLLFVLSLTLDAAPELWLRAVCDINVLLGMAVQHSNHRKTSKCWPGTGKLVASVVTDAPHIYSAQCKADDDVHLKQNNETVGWQSVRAIRKP